MKLTPWPFQERVIKNMVDYANSYNGTRKSGYVVAPTGTGKSFIIANVVYNLARPTIVLQPSKELLGQNYNKFANHGGMATIFSASANSKMSSSCTFATPGSVVKHGQLFRHVYNIKTLIIDECHFKVKTSTDDGIGQVRQFIEDLQPEIVIGLTATPVRLVTDGMGPTLKMLHRTREKIFNDVIDVVQIQEIMEEYWKSVEYKQYDFDEGSLKLNSTGSDFTEESIKAAVLANNVNNNICLEIIKQVKDFNKKAILVFCDSVEAGQKMADWLQRKGIRAGFVSGKTPTKQRETTVENFLSGMDNVLINHSTFTTGFDYPALDCIMLGRPTNSFSMLYQMIGRLVRRHIEIKMGLCIDFCNNIKRLGYIEEVNFEKVPGYGWGMFNGDILMSDRPLNFAKKTKKDLILDAQFNLKKMPYDYIHFGKYRGDHMATLPNEYLIYLKKNISDLRKKEMQIFYERFQKELKIRNLI